MIRLILVVGFIVGVVVSYPKVQYAWHGDGSLINIAYLAEWGIGFALLALVVWGVVRLIVKVVR